MLTSYDPRGGYGHPDQIQVHRVATAAGRLLPWLPLGGAEAVFPPRGELTHAVDVRPFLRQKRAALRAHASQADGGRALRMPAVLSRLPWPLFALVSGREWSVEAGRKPTPESTATSSAASGARPRR